jgi:hypothetical protein
MVLTSVAELIQQAQNSSNEELLTFCKSLGEILPEIQIRVGLEDSGDPQKVAFQCRRAATEVVAACKERSFNAIRLAGYVEQGTKDWIEHEVALVKLENSWLIIDLTAAQFPRFREKSIVIILCEPDWANLEGALQDSYSWWVPNSKT